MMLSKLASHCCYTVVLLYVVTFLYSCNKDEMIATKNLAPVIELDSERSVYTIKSGRQLTITPVYKNVDNAIYIWTIDGKLYSRSPDLFFQSDELGIHYANIRVDTEYGTDQEEMKIEIVELTPPQISVQQPSQGIKVVKGKDFQITPEIAYKDVDDFSIVWIRDGDIVCCDTTYTFNESELGIYPISIIAKNIDGKTQYDFCIEVVNTEPYVVSFPLSYYGAPSDIKYTYVGRSVYLHPHIEYFDAPIFTWTVDGKEVDSSNNQTFVFTPNSQGEYLIEVNVSESKMHDTKEETEVGRNAVVKVVCVSGTPAEKLRQENVTSSMLWNKVYDFTPAPGQFINETGGAEFTGMESTMEQAIDYATTRLRQFNYVSLGAFGGYIVVGFDHSILNNGGDDYDFAIQGNAFSSSNEPGIVWVMQDTNGNGLPDDEWYELRGSETGKPETTQYYEVTYFRGNRSSGITRWIDSDGISGRIDHNMYHTQPFYYPNWIVPDTYTLVGTCLRNRNVVDPSGYWSNNSYDWGYVDNIGYDCITDENLTGQGQMNGFKISNAMYPDGSKVDLEYIDFIKVQCGVQAQSGPLGELSTEVFSFEDL